MIILNYISFKLFELKNERANILPQNKNFNLKISDDDGLHHIIVKLTSYGWSAHREIIYYEFTIIESDSEFYRKDGVLLLGLDFDKKVNNFYFYPYYNDTGKFRMHQMSELIKNAYIELR